MKRDDREAGQLYPAFLGPRSVVTNSAAAFCAKSGYAPVLVIR